MKREVKNKGKKGRHTYLNAEFQRIVRRDKKAFLSDQCKEIEENNREKTGDLGLVFADSIELLHLWCKDYNQFDFSIDHLVMSMCRVVFCVVGRECLQ